MRFSLSLSLSLSLQLRRGSSPCRIQPSRHWFTMPMALVFLFETKGLDSFAMEAILKTEVSRGGFPNSAMQKSCDTGPLYIPIHLLISCHLPKKTDSWKISTKKQTQLHSLQILKIERRKNFKSFLQISHHFHELLLQISHHFYESFLQISHHFYEFLLKKRIFKNF